MTLANLRIQDDVRRIISRILEENNTAFGVLVDLGVIQLADFGDNNSFSGLHSWCDGDGWRHTVIYSEKAMVLVTNDSFAGVAAYDAVVLGSRDLRAFRGPQNQLAVGML